MQAGDAAQVRDGESEFGTAVKLPLTSFIVFGLITFWVYTAWRLGAELRAHFAGRWSEMRPRLQAAGVSAERLEALRRLGYPDGMAPAGTAAALFALAGVLVVGWFTRWVLTDAEPTVDYGRLMIAVGASAAVFYGATCLLTLWIARRLFHHETVELLLQERGPASAQRSLTPSAPLVARWERHNNHVALFLILTLAMVASPVVGAHFFITGGGAAELQWIAALCFALAAVFHFWGVQLLAGLLNAHLETEAAQAGRAGRVVAHAQPVPVEGLEPYDGAERFIFVSYKRDDFARIRPVLERIRDSGYRLWYDKGIPGGAEWDALIEQKLKGCAMLLFFVSRGSVESKYCRREVKYVDQLGKPILSVRLEPAELAHGLEMLLTQYQMVDASNRDFAGEIERALKYLRLL